MPLASTHQVVVHVRTTLLLLASRLCPPPTKALCKGTQNGKASGSTENSNFSWVTSSWRTWHRGQLASPRLIRKSYHLDPSCPGHLCIYSATSRLPPSPSQWCQFSIFRYPFQELFSQSTIMYQSLTKIRPSDLRAHN